MNRCYISFLALLLILPVSDTQFRPFLPVGQPPRNWITRSGLPSPIPGGVLPPPNPDRFVRGPTNPVTGRGFPPRGLPNPFTPARFPAPLPNTVRFPTAFNSGAQPNSGAGASLPVSSQARPPTRFSSNVRLPFSPLGQVTGTSVARSWPPSAAGTSSQNEARPLPQPQPTAPQTLTFTPLSGNRESVTISATEVDSLYSRIKSIFDQAYPDLPPLRRTDIRVLFQVQRSQDLVDSTAVVSNDLSTLYVPYQIPDRNNLAFIPFDRNNKELKYPQKPIFLPYPQLSVRIGDRNFPVYLPFQPDSSRSPDDVPQVFIPFENPPVPVADYIVFLPFIPEALSVNRNRAQNEPEWNGLRVTSGRNLSDPNILAAVPKTETEALIQGYTLISDCSGSFLGKRYVQNQDTSLILIFDLSGTIAGIQTGVPYGLTNGYPTQNLVPRPFVPEGTFLFLTTYFINPAKICTSGRSEGDLAANGLGTDLYIQNGPDPIKDSVKVPKEETELQRTMWTRGKCFPSQGTHYGYNVRPDMPCEELIPIHLLYDRGRLKGFAWILLSQLPSTQKRYEYFDQNYFSAIYTAMPSCFYITGPITSLHVFLVDNPLMLQCS